MRVYTKTPQNVFVVSISASPIGATDRLMLCDATLDEVVTLMRDIFYLRIVGKQGLLKTDGSKTYIRIEQVEFVDKYQGRKSDAFWALGHHLENASLIRREVTKHCAGLRKQNAPSVEDVEQLKARKRLIHGADPLNFKKRK